MINSMFMALASLALAGALTGCSGSFCAAVAQPAAQAPPAAAPQGPLGLHYVDQTLTVGDQLTASPGFSNGTPGQVPAFSLASGPLPPGLALDTSGVITGTATGAGVFPFTVEVTEPDREPGTGGATYTVHPAGSLVLGYQDQSLAVNVALNPPLGPSLFSNATPGLASSFTLVAGGALPDGLTLKQDDGTISGTPTVEGAFPFTIQVAQPGRDPATASAVYTVGQPPRTSDQTFDIHLNPQGADQLLGVVNSGGKITRAIAVSGSFPPGLDLSPTPNANGDVGDIVGVLTSPQPAPRTYLLTITYANAFSPPSTSTITINVSD